MAFCGFITMKGVLEPNKCDFCFIYYYCLSLLPLSILSSHQRSHAAALHDRPVRADAENLQGVCQTAGFLRRVPVHEGPPTAEYR